MFLEENFILRKQWFFLMQILFQHCCRAVKYGIIWLMKNDWGAQVKKDLDEINMDINTIKQISTKKFKEIVKEK